MAEDMEIFFFIIILGSLPWFILLPTFAVGGVALYIWDKRK